MTVIPAVSHAQWQYVRVYTDYQLGPGGVGADELSFERQLGVLLDVKAENLKRAQTMERQSMLHPEWERPVVQQVEFERGGRDHRPEIGESVVDELEATLDEVYVAPVDELPFDRKLELLTEKYGRFLETFSIVITVEWVGGNQSVDTSARR